MCKALGSINNLKLNLYKFECVRRWWPTPVILATQEAEIRRIVV
jgi:hypothetical protein